ncbi:ephrin type-B receptor 1-like isoform X2 [Rhincodon typus]|uniref:ephrin type-B receptor 1-like isoform X2 n=1 Tax=Rhincodon typus TaxID=259920 RepID=UPI0020300AA3|nr:ephrin type-B receptor 1-like isoform X2 [Rhincodon typus]
MNMGIWLLLCLTPTVLAVEEVLLDTQLEQDELNWLVTPEGGWEETVAVDKLFNTMRTYRVCNVDRPNQDNWLRSAYIARRDAQMVYVDLRFTVRDCSSIPSTDGSCRETFALYYGEVDSDGVPSASTAAHLKATYAKARDITAEHVFALNRMGKVNRVTVPIGPLTRAGFHLAFWDRGACINLLSVRASFRKCPATIANLARFPETAAGPGLSSLAVTPGTCVANAVETSVPVKLHCASEGDWVVPIGGCGCRPGYRSNEELTACTESEEQAIVFKLGSEQRPSQHALAPSCGHLERLLRANQRQLEEQAQALSHLTQAVEALNSTLLGISHRLHLLLSDAPDTLPDRAIAPDVNG